MERSTLIALEKHLYAIHLEMDGLARLITKQLIHLSQVAASVEHFRRMSFDIYKHRTSLEQIPSQVLYETALDYEDWLEEEFDEIPASWQLATKEEEALEQLWQDFLQTRDPFSEFRHRIFTTHPAKDRIGCRLDRNVQVTNDDRAPDIFSRNAAIAATAS